MRWVPGEGGRGEGHVVAGGESLKGGRVGLVDGVEVAKELLAASGQVEESKCPRGALRLVWLVPAGMCTQVPDRRMPDGGIAEHEFESAVLDVEQFVLVLAGARGWSGVERDGVCGDANAAVGVRAREL